MSSPLPSPQAWIRQAGGPIKGNPTAYGVYWRARGPAGELEPTLYLDTAWREAWRAARAEPCPQ